MTAKNTQTHPKQTKVLGEPEPNSDVLNKEPSTLLIGYGWVGQHVHKYFKNAEYYTPELGLRDKNHQKLVLPWNNQKAVDALPKGKKMWDVGFISVPTPMQEDGRCDLSIIDQVVEQWYSYVEVFVMRSTVEIGTCEWLEKKYGVPVVMQPEYIGETLGHPLLEPSRDTFIIVGGSPSATRTVCDAWAKVLHPNSRFRQVSHKTAEMCKYMENSFLATKVMFVNSFRRLASKSGVDFNQLREIWLEDPRINRSHTFAYEDNPGFSGKCLPKDLNALVYYARNIGAPIHMIEALLLINAYLRKDVETNVPLLPHERETEKWGQDLNDMAHYFEGYEDVTGAEQPE